MRSARQCNSSTEDVDDSSYGAIQATYASRHRIRTTLTVEIQRSPSRRKCARTDSSGRKRSRIMPLRKRGVLAFIILGYYRAISRLMLLTEQKCSVYSYRRRWSRGHLSQSVGRRRRWRSKCSTPLQALYYREIGLITSKYNDFNHSCCAFVRRLSHFLWHLDSSSADWCLEGRNTTTVGFRDAWSEGSK